MKPNLSIIFVVFCMLASACNYWSTLDNPGQDRDLCWEYGEERYLSCDSPTHRGLTPSEFMETHASPAMVSGEIDAWFEGDKPEFTFTFDADLDAECREVGWASWQTVPEHCRGKWELILRTQGQLTIDHASLPPVSGPGWVSIEDDGVEWSCLSFLDVTLTDEGPSVAWFDLIEHHMAAARPQRVDVYIRSQCDGADGVVHVSYEAAVGDDDVAGDREFFFEN